MLDRSVSLARSSAAHQLRVWWVPQMDTPMEPFYQPVKSLEEAALVLHALDAYDRFQVESKVKPDCCNMGGLEVYEDVGYGFEWEEWVDKKTRETFDLWMNANFVPAGSNK